MRNFFAFGKKVGFVFLACALVILAGPAAAVDTLFQSLSIVKIRAVGDYQGSTFDNTFEIWFAEPVVYSAGSKCTSTFRVYVDAKHKHIYAAALTALISGRKVRINVDDNLPIRDGACEVSFLDIDP